MTHLVRYQLIAFVLIAVIGVSYVGATYVRLDEMFGLGVYHVRVESAETGGLYQGAEVTYRGVPVGRVGELELTEAGVTMRLDISADAPKIPASATAVVANRSAIGEQYLDLQPDSPNGPFLQNDSVIRGAVTPVAVEQLLAGVDHFTNSVDLAALHTSITELGRAFHGKGDDLQVLVQSLNNITADFHTSLPQTIKLIRDGRIALGTQAEQSGAIREFSDGLDQLTAQLRASDPDVRRMIGTGTDAGEQIDGLLVESGAAITQNLASLRTMLKAVSPKFYALQPILMMMPPISFGGSAAAPGDGTTHFGYVFELNYPPACSVGYEGTRKILADMKAANPDFDDTRDDFPFNTEAQCTVPFGNPTAVRGGARAEFADPSIPQPWDGTPKSDPDKLDVSPIAIQVATLLGVTPKR